MNRVIRVAWPWVIAVVALTIMTLLFRHSAEYKLARELNPVDIFTALLTLFLAIYIPTRLERRLTSKRYEQEVLIRSVERLQADFTAIRNQVISTSGPLNNEQLAAIIQGFNSTSHGIKTLSELSSICGRTDLQASLKQLERRRLKFKRIVTGTGFQRDPTFMYDAIQFAEIDNKYYENDLELAKLIIRINRMI